jgi:hypothetical protein
MTAKVLENLAWSAARTTPDVNVAYAETRQCVCDTWDMPSLALAMTLC